MKTVIIYIPPEMEGFFICKPSKGMVVQPSPEP